MSARDGAIHGLSYTSIHGDVAYVDDTFTTNRLVWQDAEGGHVVSGNAQLGGAKALDLTVQSDNIRLESLLHAADLPLDATGWATNSLTVHGTVDQPEASGELHLWDGSVLGELYQDVVVRYRYNGDILYLDEALASMYNGTLHASGTIAPNALNVQLPKGCCAAHRPICVWKPTSGAIIYTLTVNRSTVCAVTWPTAKAWWA